MSGLAVLASHGHDARGRFAYGAFLLYPKGWKFIPDTLKRGHRTATGCTGVRKETTPQLVIAHFVGSTRGEIVVQRDLIMPSKQRLHGPATGRFFRTTSFILLLACSHLSAAAGSALEAGFRTVPDGARPWAYWWWLNGNIDEPTITRDLEAMRQQGFGGFLLFDARGYHDDQSHVVVPPPKMEFMSEEWRRMLRFALHKADALGLEVSVNLSSCAGALKGPWELACRHDRHCRHHNLGL